MDETFITLHCKHCENDDCIYLPTKRFVYGEEGCTRKISDATAAQYYHYTQEVLPF